MRGLVVPREIAIVGKSETGSKDNALILRMDGVNSSWKASVSCGVNCEGPVALLIEVLHEDSFKGLLDTKSSIVVVIDILDLRPLVI